MPKKILKNCRAFQQWLMPLDIVTLVPGFRPHVWLNPAASEWMTKKADACVIHELQPEMKQNCRVPATELGHLD